MIKKYKAFLESIVNFDLPIMSEIKDYFQVLTDLGARPFSTFTYYVIEKNSKVGNYINTKDNIEENEKAIGYFINLIYDKNTDIQELNPLLSNVLFNIRNDLNKDISIYYSNLDIKPNTSNIMIIIIENKYLNLFKMSNGKPIDSYYKLYTTNSILENVNRNTQSILPTKDEIKDYVQALSDINTDYVDINYYVRDVKGNISSSDYVNDRSNMIGYYIYMVFLDINDEKEIKSVLDNVLFNLRSDIKSDKISIYYELTKSSNVITLSIIIVDENVSGFSEGAMKGLKLYNI